MGNPVEPNGYDLGNPCVACLGDNTPERMLCIFSGITACPLLGGTPNGSFILTQNTPCSWRGETNRWVVVYIAKAGLPGIDSILTVGDKLWPGNAFDGINIDPCVMSFNSFLVLPHCGFSTCYGGSGNLLYGPGI